MLKDASPGGTFLLNTPYGADEVWDTSAARRSSSQIVDKKLKFYVIDAVKVARESGMGGRINTVMQVCFFAISGVLPRDEAIEAIKYRSRRPTARRARRSSRRTCKAVDNTLAHLHRGEGPEPASTAADRAAAARAAGSARVRARRAGRDHRRPRRRAARQRAAVRRHVPDRHRRAGRSATSRSRFPCGTGGLHPVRQVRDGLPARVDPRQGLRAGRAGERAGDLQVHRRHATATGRSSG